MVEQMAVIKSSAMKTTDMIETIRDLETSSAMVQSHTILELLRNLAENVHELERGQPGYNATDEILNDPPDLN